MLLLLRERGIDPIFTVYELPGGNPGRATEPTGEEGHQADEDTSRRFLVIIHVRNDADFKKYFNWATLSDLPLFRGLFLEVVLTADLSRVLGSSVLQAFYPKFENEGQDATVAEKITQEADHKLMAITIKHSGSLLTLSHKLCGAKNSAGNLYAAGGAVLLRAHYQRLFPEDAEKADAALRALIERMTRDEMALGFELVTGCLGHHGQMPRMEYVVLTSAHVRERGSLRFLSLVEVLEFAAEYRLPANDTWLVFSRDGATAVRTVLDAVCSEPAATAEATRRLTEAVAAAGGMHIPGSYTHASCQGSRQEGYVVSQGQEITLEVLRRFDHLRTALAACVIDDTRVTDLHPYASLVQRFEGDSDRVRAAITATSPPWMPAVSLNERVPEAVRERIINVLRESPADEAAAGTGQLSRLRCASLPAADLRRMAGFTPEAAEDEAEDEDEPLTEELFLSTFRAAAGAIKDTSTLRYKKKFILYNSTLVGYCMMTFVIRNGLPSLKKSDGAYMSYVARLADSWGLTAAQKQQVTVFAKAWLRHIEETPGAFAALGDGSGGAYLDVAEPFVERFLGGAYPTRPRLPGSFRGLLLLLNPPPGVTERDVAGLLDLRHVPGVRALVPTELFELRMEDGTVYTLPVTGRIKWPNEEFQRKAGRFTTLAYWPFDPNAFEEAERAGAQKAYAQWMEHVQRWLARSISPEMGETEAAVAERTAALVRQRMVAMPTGAAAIDLPGRVGSGAGAPVSETGERDPAYALCFTTMPGIGKSTLCTAGGGFFNGPAPPGWRVVVYHGDILGDAFYDMALDPNNHTCAGSGALRVVVLDRNLVPSPQGHIARTAQRVRDAGFRPVAVVPKSQGDLYGDRGTGHPFSLPLVALCMLRVLERATHEGVKPLVGTLPNALAVVAMFAGFFPSMRRASFMERVIEPAFSDFIEVEFMDEAAVTLSPELQEAVRWGIRTSQKQMNKGKKAAQEAAAEWAEWETKMRALLQEHAGPLKAAARPVAHIQQQIAAGLQALVGKCHRSLGYLTINPPNASDAAWRDAFRTAFARIPTVAGIELRAPDAANLLHVTLWHVADKALLPPAALRRRNVSGPVRLEVVGVHQSPEVSAAQVRVVGETLTAKDFLHITLRTGPGVAPVASNFLPGRLAAGEPSVTYTAVDPPIPLEGVVVLHFFDDRETPASAVPAAAPLPIDGALLEGGGQVLRQSFALATILGRPIRVFNIRARRPVPGLRPQHLAGIRLLRDMSGGVLAGEGENATDVSYAPGPLVRADGDVMYFIADCGTAGAATLMLQAALPCAVFAPAQLSLRLCGGTDVLYSPPASFVTEVLLPALSWFGIVADVRVVRRGFYPDGKGELRVTTVPRADPLRAVQRVERGAVVRVWGHAWGTPAHASALAQMASDARRALSETSWAGELAGDVVDCQTVAPAHAGGQGAGISLYCETSTGCVLSGSALLDADPTPGRTAAAALAAAVESGCCVDEHLQDQLVVYMALARGLSAFRTGPLTLHTETAIHFAEALTGARFTVTRDTEGASFVVACEGIGFFPQGCR